MLHVAALCRLAALGTLAIWCFLLPSAARAQQDSLPYCKPAALDIWPEYFNAPHDYFMIALHLRNISGEACIPDLPLYFPQFTSTENPPGKSFGICDACEDRLPNGRVRWQPPLLLSPREGGYQTYRWKTDPPHAGVKCQQLSALGGPAFLIVAPTLLKPVCSDIEVSRYYPDTWPGLPRSKDQDSSETRDPEALVLSTSKRTYYDGEGFSIHVSLAFPGAGSPTREECPTLFLRERAADGSTRIDERHPEGFKGCKWFDLGANLDADWQTGFELRLGAGGIGTQSFELSEVVDSTKGGRIQFAQSNELKVQIETPSAISRKWGLKAKGVAVDVTLDKATYDVGEDVPLHIAVENFDAAAPVYAIDPAWDPAEAIAIEVRDTQGRLLPESERSSPRLWMGHGRGPVLYPPGKLVPIERSLKGQGWLPKRPGTYVIVVTWATRTAPGSGEESGLRLRSDLQPYATVQAVAPLNIVAVPPAF